MFQVERPKSILGSVIGTFELIFHASVHKVRKGHGNAIVGLLLNILQMVLMIVVFFTMMSLLGARGMAIRGNYVVYLMTGIFFFFTHIKAIGAVASADGPTSTMMQHAPMNTVISIVASALASLYQQFLAVAVILYLYHAAIEPISIHDPVGAMGMMLLSWGSGVGIGMILMAAKPWAPDFFGILTQVYMRANMFASGKMMVANNTPGHILQWFTWNPLFHTIDQGRGFVFQNYHPHNSNIAYPLACTFVCILIGLMAEFYTRKHISVSWNARR